MEAGNSMKEVWKDIEGYETLYQVSNLGRVRSLDRYTLCNNGIRRLNKGRVIKLIKDKKGYLTLTLCKDTKQKGYKVHRLVANEFLPNYENKPQVNHIDGDKTNNNVKNLEWCTNGENGTHAYKNNLKSNVKPVRCVNTGEIFYSLREASRKMKTCRKEIVNCCKGEREYAGFDKNRKRLTWEYVERNPKL